MIRVIIESPYAAPTLEGVQRNVNYARACVRDCLIKGEAPYASHLFFTQPGVLDDKIPEERLLGIIAGLLWGEAAEKTVVYTDLGISKGMEQGMAQANIVGRPIERRSLLGWKNETSYQS